MKALPILTLLIFAALPAAAQFTEINSALPKPPFPLVVWGDYDGDGDLDVLVSGEGKQNTAFATIYNNTGGTFSDSGISLLGLSRASAAWGDFDNDGDLDLAMTGQTVGGGVATRVYRNNGGSFGLVPGSFTAVYVGNVAWADYDGDGDLDLLVTGVTNSSPGALAVTQLYRNEAGVFTSVAHPFPNCYLGAVAWGDYDNDGDPDVVITGTSNTGGLVAGLWRNDGGSFTDAGAVLPGMDLGFATWGDYDGDGDLDLLFGGNTNDGWISRLYRNDGGTFVDANAGLLGVLWSSAAWGDYDNDGDLDAMIIGYDAVAQTSRSILYRNDAGSLVDSGIAFHQLYLGTVNWMDYDNDGDLDLLLAGNESGVGDYLRIVRNNSAVQNTAPTAPTNLGVNVLGTSVEFSWSPASDVQSPAAALTYNLRVGTTPGGSQIIAPHSASTGFRRLPVAGNVWQIHTTKLRSLVPGTTYYWSAQSVDTAFAGSTFATEGSFTALTDPPQNVTFAREAGGFRSIWRGTPGFAYRVEFSEDLVSWTPAASPTAAAGTGLFDYLDAPPVNTPKRFYRSSRQ
ncbi:MAG: FG-GAP-like repeat-containing protein [Luteolibacter sp.]